MAQKFLVELHCHSDAQSIRNMIADVIGEDMFISVVEVDEEAAQQKRGADSLCWQCHHANGEHSLDCTVGKSTDGSR